jgi:hypothetical protein
MQEVRGSNPLISTIIRKDYQRLAIEGLPAFFGFRGNFDKSLGQ